MPSCDSFLHLSPSGSLFVHSPANTLRVEFVIQDIGHLPQRNEGAVNEEVYLTPLADPNVALDAHNVVLDRMWRIVGTINLVYFCAKFAQPMRMALVVVCGWRICTNFLTGKPNIPLFSPLLKQPYALLHTSGRVGRDKTFTKLLGVVIIDFKI